MKHLLECCILLTVAWSILTVNTTIEPCNKYVCGKNLQLAWQVGDRFTISVISSVKERQCMRMRCHISWQFMTQSVDIINANSNQLYNLTDCIYSPSLSNRSPDQSSSYPHLPNCVIPLIGRLCSVWIILEFVHPFVPSSSFLELAKWKSMLLMASSILVSRGIRILYLQLYSNIKPRLMSRINQPFLFSVATSCIDRSLDDC